MGSTERPRKVIDYETAFPCASGYGISREEVWMDEEDRVVRYNLAFIVPHLTRVDNGRILGYDNRHGHHERHFMGKVQAVDYEGFPSISERFYQEVAAIRRGYEDKSVH
jgi:hypothetical protein